jgi:hypothetical protein
MHVTDFLYLLAAAFAWGLTFTLLDEEEPQEL